MGTRNLTVVVANGETKIAKYGQWDGYPSGQGLTALNFLRSMDREKLIEALGKTFDPTEDQIAAWWLEVGHDIKNSDGFVACEIAKQYNDKHPSLSRDIGADILAMIQNSADPVPLHNSIEFAADSLFCEWAWVIDLDKNTFEAFSGFNESPLPEGERFAYLNDKAERGYYPVKHVHTFDLGALPTDDEFLAILDPKEGEEE